MSGNFIFRKHVEPRVELYSPRDESFLFSTEVHWRFQNYTYKLGCYARKPHRWLLEYRWIKRFVWFLDRFHSFCSTGRKISRRICVVRWEINEKTTYIQARSFMDRNLENNGKYAKLKEKHKWSNEELHLENARKLRGIYFIDPEDKEFKETVKDARKKLETPIAPAMPCKIMKKNCGSGASNKLKTRLACVPGAGESTRLHMGESPPNHHEDHIARKGSNSPQHYHLVHKFNPTPSSHKNSSSKGSSGQGMGKIGENFGVELDENQKQERGDWWSKGVGRNSSFCITDGHVIWKMLNWRQSTKIPMVEL